MTDAAASRVQTGNVQTATRRGTRNRPRESDRVLILRGLLVLATLAYAAVFHATYRDLVFPQQQSWGAGYRTLPDDVLVMVYALCVLPSLWMPLRFRRPSQLLFYVQYYIVFIPSAFMVFYGGLPELSIGDGVMLLLWMSAGLAVLESVYFFPLGRVRRLRFSPRLFWVVAAAIGLGVFAYTFAVMRSNFRLVSLDRIYDVRGALGDVITASGSRLVVYAQAWMANVILPLGFAIGMFARRWWLAAIALAGYVFIFGVSGQKVALMAIGYLPGFYLLLRRDNGKTGTKIVLAFTSVLALAYAVDAWFPPLVSTSYVAVINFRTFTIQGMAAGQYFDFFRTHPHTYFSHLAGVRSFVHYPYAIDIPYTIGDYYYNTPVGANAGMWAADAIAGVGAWAIPLVSAFAGAVFWFLDTCSRRLDPRFAALAIAYIGTSFANVSLGTTLVTGGLALVCIIFLMLPERGRLAQAYNRASASGSERTAAA